MADHQAGDRTLVAAAEEAEEAEEAAAAAEEAVRVLMTKAAVDLGGEQDLASVVGAAIPVEDHIDNKAMTLPLSSTKAVQNRRSLWDMDKDSSHPRPRRWTRDHLHHTKIEVNGNISNTLDAIDTTDKVVIIKIVQPIRQE